MPIRRYTRPRRSFFLRVDRPSIESARWRNADRKKIERPQVRRESTKVGDRKASADEVVAGISTDFAVLPMTNRTIRTRQTANLAPHSPRCPDIDCSRSERRGYSSHVDDFGRRNNWIRRFGNVTPSKITK
ncbi:hypothetical protein GWI33_023332 [Rhynchophorus ferrugineus]|uniref:Uncharacterized protein n=1 Tax=Rhynchophorus ferrugineus TaxID=354439 RepID=A0A834HLH0_RHYFE|nr:hypothetical protein GWI33_023332 [Rhynchophorus ferrugineus]